MHYLKRIRILAAVLALSLLFALTSCGPSSRAEETRLIFKDDPEYSGHLYYTEQFIFLEHTNPARDDTPVVEKTGYRIAERNLQTGEEKSGCIDPLCDHGIDSSSPLVSRLPIEVVCASDGKLFFYCNKNSRSASELKCYDLRDGSVQLIFSEDVEAAENSFIIGDKFVWYTMPEIIDRKTVYVLNRYELSGGKTLTLARFEDAPRLFYLTDSRIYLGRHPLSVGNPEDLELFSLDYDGQNRREEYSQIHDYRLSVGSAVYSMAHLDVGALTTSYSPHFYRYDFSTRELTKFPLSGDAAVSIGYRESDGRVYYVSSEGADDVLTLNQFTRSRELGITVEEFMSDLSLMRQLSDDVLNATYGYKSYLKSCNPDGSDEKVVFEFPAGTFFHQTGTEGLGPRINRKTGCVSPDGKKYYVTAQFRGESGERIMKSAEIDLDTGEITYVD